MLAPEIDEADLPEPESGLAGDFREIHKPQIAEASLDDVEKVGEP